MVDVGEPLELSAIEARVLGALLEKELTTPDGYPMSLNALTMACNQSSNRDPVVHHEPRSVETTVLVLKTKGLARVVHPGSGERVTKYRQVADEALSLSRAERALLCVLLLRGAQTVAELRTRTERLHPFAAAGEVEAVLAGLAGRERPLAAAVDRQPGQKEGRWIQLLEADAEHRAAVTVAPRVTAAARDDSRVEALERQVAALDARLRALVEALGDLVQLSED